MDEETECMLNDLQEDKESPERWVKKFRPCPFMINI